MEPRYIMLEVTWGRYINGMKHFVMYDTEKEMILDLEDSDQDYEVLVTRKVPGFKLSILDEGWD